ALAGPLLRRYRPLELRLVHLRTALDAELLRLVVELIASRPLRPVGAGPEPSAPSRGDVARRGPRGRPRLAASRALLVDGPGSDLLGFALAGPALAAALLDVLVLTLPLRS